jgi:hypothetical protein
MLLPAASFHPPHYLSFHSRCYRFFKWSRVVHISHARKRRDGRRRKFRESRFPQKTTLKDLTDLVSFSDDDGSSSSSFFSPSRCEYQEQQ